MASDRIAIVGAGVAGLTVARALRSAGLRAHVFDKGRRHGGRLATRQSRSGPGFDHGAQYVTARGPGFKAVLAGAHSSGMADVWDRVDGHDRYVGTPEMNALAGYLARAVDVRTGTEVTGLTRSPSGWTLTAGADEMVFDRVIVTAPAPQTAQLLGDHPLAERVARAVMAPCLTLMAAFTPGGPAAFKTREDDLADLAWIAHDGSKPGRGETPTWVAQAGEVWSRAHLEADKDEIAALMLPMLCDAIGRSPDEATTQRGHRWRYARVTLPLSEPYLCDESETLFVGGDWCLGPRVEAAWDSGAAIADAIIRSRL